MAVGLTMSGQCNLGESEQNFRVPDSALHRNPPTGVWNPTAPRQSGAARPSR